MTARAERILVRLRRCTHGELLLFSSGHVLRVLAACWLRLDPIVGRHPSLGTAVPSTLGYRADPLIYLWNDCTTRPVRNRSPMGVHPALLREP